MLKVIGAITIGVVPLWLVGIGMAHKVGWFSTSCFLAGIALGVVTGFLIGVGLFAPRWPGT